MDNINDRGQAVLGGDDFCYLRDPDGMLMPIAFPGAMLIRG